MGSIGRARLRELPTRRPEGQQTSGADEHDHAFDRSGDDVAQGQALGEAPQQGVGDNGDSDHVVAHRVSMMTVQAGAAKVVAIEDPVAARRAMEAVENAGRQALDELRHLLAVLRPAAGADNVGPQPGLADIPRLVDQLREAGLRVSLTMEGVPRISPPR